MTKLYDMVRIDGGRRGGDSHTREPRCIQVERRIDTNTRGEPETIETKGSHDEAEA